MADSTSVREPEATPTSPVAPVPAVGTRLSAEEIHENVREAAESEMRRSAWALFWSALGAGLTISFSFLAAGYLAMQVPDAWRPAAAAAGYPLGFIFVVLARSQLFTENTLEPIIPLLNDPSARMLGRVLRLWAIVLFGNLLGALIIAWALARSPVVDATLSQSLGRLAVESTSGGFQTVFYRAIFAGWLVALMAWLVASTSLTGAQIALIWLTTAPIAAFGFRHSIAGAVEAFYRVGIASAPWSAMLGQFIAPAVLGNIVGGALLVGLVNHGQVAADRTFEESWQQRWGPR